MSKKTILFGLLTFLFLNSHAQKNKSGSSSIKTNTNLPYGKNTYKTLILEDGSYQVYRLPNGKLYINRISKVGEVVRQYIN